MIASLFENKQVEVGEEDILWSIRCLKMFFLTMDPVNVNTKQLPDEVDECGCCNQTRNQNGDCNFISNVFDDVIYGMKS